MTDSTVAGLRNFDEFPMKGRAFREQSAVLLLLFEQGALIRGHQLAVRSDEVVGYG